MNQQTNYRLLSKQEKREIISYRLNSNFPTILTALFATAFVTIGLAGIGLQIGLIVNQAVNYEICNGIWGGLFAILNGCLKFNMSKFLIKQDFNRFSFYLLF